MKTTLNIDDELLRLAQKRAAQEGASLGTVVEDALRSHLARPIGKPRYRLQWRTESGTLRHGVNFNDRDPLFERMEPRIRR